MEKMNEFWSLNEGTFYCLYDSKRTLAFRKAIRNTVKKGDVVVDLGSGSGVLSFFAADAGATKVYAVELDDANVQALRQTIKMNGYEDTVEVLQGDATSMDLPEKPDVIICELIATGLIEELQIPAMNNVHRFAKQTTRVVLQEYDILVDLVQQRNDFYNKKYHMIRYEFPDKTSLRAKPFSEKTLLQKVDFRKKQGISFISKELTLRVVKPGLINGVRISSLTHFADSSTLDHSLAYSFPVILPIEEFRVKKGDRFKLKISYSMCEGPHKLKYSVKKI